MANTYVQLYVHVTFHVKTTGVKIRHDDLPRLFRYISGIVTGVGSSAIAVGGIEDHVHILATLPKNMILPDFIKAIKTGSNAWLKTLDAEYEKFAWQDGYGAFSVSASRIEQVQNYIMSQEEHHRRMSCSDEYRQWLDAYKVKFDERYAFSD